ncbi:MAG: hypothetical protein LV480_01230 [Methylacidiphilales bacterium]|nr:hypothetical protein [Candidatus Methylacidiphilales bacterium]
MTVAEILMMKFLSKHWGKIFLLLVVFYILAPIDQVEECLGLTSGRMTAALRIGRLAPFPKDRKNFQIGFHEGIFHALYMGSFSDRPEVIAKWLKDSPGVQEGDSETLYGGSTRYILQTAGWPGYVDVSPDRTGVSFMIGQTLDPMPKPHRIAPSIDAK